jgi:hypothetical protein
MEIILTDEMVRRLDEPARRIGAALAQRFAAIGGKFPARIYDSMRLERLRKNSSSSVRSPKSIVLGLKLRSILPALSARVNSCPDTRPHPEEFFGCLSRPAELTASLPATPECGPGGRRYLFRGKLLTLASAAALCATPACAQYVGQVSKGDNAPELRSVAVLEWIGDQEHPTQSRIIPITVFDGQQLQDGGIYLARPQPLALDSDVEYQLKEDGKSTGLFVVYGASQENGSWVGYGKLQPMPKPKPPKPLNAQDFKADDTESDQPVLHRKHQAGDSGSGSSSTGGSSGSGNPAETPDPDRPTLHKAPGSGSDSGSDSGSNSGSQTATDPDRPTLHKSPDSDSSSTADSGSGAQDPDRPKLSKKKNSNSSDEEGSVSSVDSTDPNRPTLKRGQVSYGTDSGGPAPPTLKGLPPEMHQTVAVSDARNQREHLWDYSWANPDDQQKYKGQLEDLARTALGLTPPPAPKTKTAAKTATHKSTKAAATAPPAEPPPLEDEQFRVFELAYSSGATMVLSAHTAGEGAQEKFVTLVAQPDLYGNVEVLLKNTTDASRLDEAPRLRLIDAVDAMADNRGELLFELRGATGRQFALYRVLRGQVTRLFVSGGADASASN